MKIERISDKQIRCTLNKADLADRDIMITELAYGTEKAKELFREMMRQASYEVGFEAEDIPLMIEAIPISPECLILIITKVEDPEELDTRFSKFSKPQENYDTEYEDTDSLNELLEGAEQVASLNEDTEEEEDEEEEYDEEEELPFAPTSNESDFIPLNRTISPINEQEQVPLVYKIFSFPSLDCVTKVSSLLAPIYNGDNSLYKNTVESKYYLLLSNETQSAEVFNKVCNILSEYGRKVKSTYATPHFLTEHFTLIVKGNAIQTLSTLY